jgi:hypothetical protein
MHPTRAERLPWREIDGRAVIVQPRAGKVHELNPVATQLWRGADGRRSVEELAREVATRFDVEPPRALADATEFFRSLQELGLVTWPESSPS